ncbi:MAG: c-type cytochrome [Alphaproteobacteria bacterium]
MAGAASADGDADKGRELAEQWCTRCHNIEQGGPFKLHPPSFAAIAIYRIAEQIWGRIVFPPLHSSMRGIEQFMDPESLDDLVAYIVSLEAQ